METKMFIKCSRCKKSFEVQTVNALTNGTALGVKHPISSRVAVPTITYFAYEKLYLCDDCHKEFYDWFVKYMEDRQ